MATTTGTNTGRTGEFFSGLSKWRTINSGATKTTDGAQFWWCPNHKHKDGLWDGLYVRHPPEKHDEDEKHDEIMAKFANKRKAPEVEVNKEKKTPANTNAILDFQESMKNVLMADLCMSADDVDELLNLDSGN